MRYAGVTLWWELVRKWSAASGQWPVMNCHPERRRVFCGGVEGSAQDDKVKTRGIYAVALECAVIVSSPCPFGPVSRWRSRKARANPMKPSKVRIFIMAR